MKGRVQLSTANKKTGYEELGCIFCSMLTASPSKDLTTSINKKFKRWKYDL